MSGRPRLTVFGTGYLGTAQAACLASLGFEVLGVDVDAARASALQAGTLPFYEPGLEPLLRAGLHSGRLSFTTSYPDAAEFGDVHFICVGTPQRPGSGGADLSQFEACFAGLAPLLRRACLVVGKSTVPPGTVAAYSQRLPGARVAVFDPAAMDRARKVHRDLDYTGSALGAARDADVLLVLTEWPEFAAADPEVLAKTVARRAVVDARHALDADAWRACGCDYRAPGRPGSAPPARTAGIRLHQAELHEAAASFLAAAV